MEPVRAAAGKAVESLESRLFMHSGAHITPTATFPTNGSQRVVTSSSVQVTFSTDVNPATLNSSNFQLRDASGNAVLGSTYVFNNRTVVFDPTGDLATTDSYFTATLKGGTGSVQDISGNALDDDLTFSFTTGKPTFTKQQVLGGTTAPTAIQFASDGRVFLAEKSGLIKVYDNLQDTTPTTVADLRTQVHNFWDRGLLGMALHPNFPVQPYIYVLYSYDADMGGTAPKFGTVGGTSDAGPDATGNGAHISGRLSRLTISGNAMVAGSEFVLINDWQQQFPSHSVGSIAFGADGALYASAGDGASFNYADYGQTGNPFNDPVNQGGALRAQDIRTQGAGDPTTLDGSVIRIDPNTGGAMTDNPLYGNSAYDANAQKIIAHGFRNPFRMTFRPGTNEIWLGDVGWGTWEEVNRIPVSTTAVANYGWPAYEGPDRQSGYDALNLPLIESLYAQGPGAVVTPYYAYKHGEKVITGSTEQTGGSSISGLAFYNSNLYPEAYNDALFFSDYSRQTVYVVYRGLNGLPDLSTRQAFQIGGIGPTQLAVAPTGELIVLDLNNTVWKFSYAAANRPPTARITSDKTTGPAPLTVQFSGSTSTDPDAGSTLGYTWDLDGDGQYDDSTAVSPVFTYTANGQYVVRLKVTDQAGAFDLAEQTIVVGNDAPVATISAPTTAIRWKVGDVINFAGSATDIQDGSLAASQLRWQLVLRHESAINPGTYHEHMVQEYFGVASGSFVAPDHEYPSSLELRLIATDSGGLTHTVKNVLLPQTSGLSFASNVAGARISLNGEFVETPYSRTVITGSDNSIVAATPQVVNGIVYNFVNWSDGGDAIHNIIAAAGTTTYTATFAAAATVPAPWQSSDIGAVGNAGTTAYSGATNTFTVSGGGADIWGASDSFRFVNQQVSGDVTIVARVKSLQNTHNNAKAGVQIRQSLAANAANVQIDVEGPGTWGEFHARSTAGGSTETQAYLPITTPHWVKLTRAGNVFTAYDSADGVTWRQIAQRTVAMTETVFVGLAVCSHDVTQLNTVEFDNVAVTVDSATRPTISSPAAATVSSAGTSANLTVAANDDGGEANLKYTWSMVSGPAAVTFTPNATNAAKVASATFTKAGAYVLRATVTDLQGVSATSDVSVTVTQRLTTIAVTPTLASIAVGNTQQFAAIARDQFGDALATQPAFTWQVVSGGVGTINSAGLYSAPASTTGSATVRATSGAYSGTASVQVNAAPSGDVTAGQTHRWSFNENAGTTSVDGAGTANLTFTGGATWTSGKGGSALNLDGVDDYASAPSSLVNDLGGTSTLTAWIKTTQVGKDTFWEAPGIVGVEKHWDSADVFWGLLNSSGKVSVKAGDDPAATSVTSVNDGAWHHLAFSRDATSGQLKVYVDGILESTVTGGVGFRGTAFNSIGRIENTNGPANYLKGALDDVRVYNRILTASEVLAIRDNITGTPVNAAPTVTTAAKTSPTQPQVGTPASLTVLGADDGGEANLTYTWSVTAKPTGSVNPVIAASGTNAAKNTTITFSAAGSYTVRCTISDGTNSVTSDVTITVIASSPTDVTAGLLHRWKFDENTGVTSADSSGAYTATLNGGAGWTAGQSGGALNLDGTDDYASTATPLVTDLGGTATLTAWIKTTQVGKDTFWEAPGIAGIEKYWDSADIFWGIINASGKIGVKAGDDAAATSTTSINDGVWHHVAFTRDSATGQLKVYVDGVLEATVTGGTGYRGTTFNSIGRIQNTNGPATYLKGALDDVRVYNRVLTAAEVATVRGAV